MKILVSGFEPFGGRLENCSAELAELAKKQIENVEVAILPVSFSRAFDELRKKIEEIKPGLVVCMGESQHAKMLLLECSALNIQSSRVPDNSGEQPRNEVIDKAVEHGLFIGSSLGEISQRIDAINGIELSFFAGTYVCNRLLFDLIKWEQVSEVPSFFIHVPLFHQGDFSADSAIEALDQFLEGFRPY